MTKARQRGRFARQWHVVAAMALTAASSAALYVTDGDGSIKVFDEFTGAYKGKWGSGFLDSPTGIAIGPDGNLYVADASRGEVFRFNALTGDYKGNFGSGFLTDPQGVAFDANGTIYVASLGDGGEVVRFTAGTGAYLGLFAQGFVSNPTGLAIDRNGKIYVASHDNGFVFRFDAATGNYMGYLGHGFAPNPYGLAVDRNEVVHVTDQSHNAVYRFDQYAGTYKGVYASGFVGQARGNAFDSQGTAYVVDGVGHQVLRFNPFTGTYMGVIGESELLSPTFACVSIETVSGTVTLQNYSAAAVAGTPVTVELRAVGSGTALETHAVSLDASGQFSFTTTLPPGAYDLAAKGSHWLRRRVSSQTVGVNGLSGLSFSLINGDINGDNAVTLGDFARLRAAFGSSPGGGNWNPEADLNGDGAVTLGDFAVLRSRFGQQGDP